MDGEEGCVPKDETVVAIVRMSVRSIVQAMQLLLLAFLVMVMIKLFGEQWTTTENKNKQRSVSADLAYPYRRCWYTSYKGSALIQVIFYIILKINLYFRTRYLA